MGERVVHARLGKKNSKKRVRINLYVRGGDQWCPNDYGLFEESHLLSWLDLVIELYTF